MFRGVTSLTLVQEIPPPPSSTARCELKVPALVEACEDGRKLLLFYNRIFSPSTETKTVVFLISCDVFRATFTSSQICVEMNA
jgi:hypothetical protein